MRLATLWMAVCIASASMAQAGIDFGAMPVGCNWTTKYSDGLVITETFVGKKQGKYKVIVTDAGNPKAQIRTVLYDAKGRMVRKNWADGNWETFTPYSCFDEAGTCTYRYQNSSGDDFKIENTTVPKGKGFHVTARPLGGEPYNDDYFETGAFGLRTKNKSKNYANTLVSMQNCEVSS